MSFKFQNSTTEDEKTVETSPLIFGKTGTTVMTNNPIDNRLNSIVQELIDSGIEIKPTKKRWLILFIYIIAAITNSMIWITFSPISVMAVDYYQLSGPFWINYLSLIFFVMYVPGVFVSSWVLDQKGLRSGITCGVSLFTLGAFIRIFGVGKETFFLTCIGQTICAMGQPFIQNSPSKVTVQWFPDNERAFATTMASVANPLGASIGLLFPPIIINFISDRIEILLLIEFFITLIVFILTLVFFRSRPIYPPSKISLQQQINEQIRISQMKRFAEFKLALVTIFKDKNFVFLFIVYSVNLSVFQTIGTLINQIMDPYGYTSGQSGMMAVFSVIFGIISSFLIGKILDRIRAYKLILVCLIAFAWYGNLLWTSFLIPNNYILLSAASAFFGFFMVPIFSLTIILVGEVTYPLPEATPVGFTVMGGMTWSGISIIVFSILIENDYIHLALYCFGFEFIICYIIMWFFTNQLKLTSQKQILNFSPVQNNDDYFSSEDISASVEMNRRFF